jgi:hypothetical protein
MSKAPTKKQKKDALALLANGGSLHEVAEHTGLTHDEVLALTKEDA